MKTAAILWDVPSELLYIVFSHTVNHYDYTVLAIDE
jgi:hypothetical protein